MHFKLGIILLFYFISLLLFTSYICETCLLSKSLESVFKRHRVRDKVKRKRETIYIVCVCFREEGGRGREREREVVLVVVVVVGGGGGGYHQRMK